MSELPQYEHFSFIPLAVLPQELHVVNSGEKAIWLLDEFLKVFTTKFAIEAAEGLDSPSHTCVSAPASMRGWKSPSFVTLSIGTPEFCSLKPPYKPPCESLAGQPQLQPLSALAYVAANCHTALANMPNVDPARIGIVGHSYGGKWAMFASCLYEKFACAVWSDPGIVFDEIRPNINYWEPWYLGWETTRQRERGVPGDSNPRTGPYKTMIETGRDLHELHALMAPRPFLISVGRHLFWSSFFKLTHYRKKGRHTHHG